jgi:hypothetical protein
MGEGAIYGLTNAEAEFHRRIIQGLILMVDDEIWLAQGTPRRWLADGLEIRVNNAATYYGPMDFTIRSEAARGRIVAKIRPPQRDPYRSIRLRLRHPDAAPMKRITVNGKQWTRFDPESETITLPRSADHLDVVAYY